MSELEALADGKIAQTARRFGSQKLVLAACVLGLVAMAMMCWSVLDPTPFPVLVAMSVGQGLGTLSLLCYLGAVFVEVWRQRTQR
jgi:MFS family permease